MAGRLLFPALPLGRKAPWVLGGLGVALITGGFIRDDTALIIVGGIGLAGVIVAYPLARLIAPPPPDEHES